MPPSGGTRGTIGIPGRLEKGGRLFPPAIDLLQGEMRKKNNPGRKNNETGALFPGGYSRDDGIVCIPEQKSTNADKSPIALSASGRHSMGLRVC